MVLEPSGERRADDICVTLMEWKARSTNPLVLSCAGVLLGSWLNTALLCFSDFE
jgi:hypothetical protein